MHDLAHGQRVGKLEVVRELGRGAYGRVYLARDMLLDRPVALKVVPGVPDATEKHRARVLREARAAGRLSSPHVVSLYAVHDTPEGGWIFEMEYVSGGTLSQLLAREGRMEPPRAARLARGIAIALAAAHAAGIVHGDVKPGNVLLDGSGEPKLADFGFARVTGELMQSQSSGRFEGTPTYMAPEVFLGEGTSRASDVWAFGILLYQMLTGRMPFQTRDWASLFFAVQHAEPFTPTPAVSAPLYQLCLACLAKRPSDRPQSWDHVLAALAGDKKAALAPAPTGAPDPVGRDRERQQIDQAIGSAAAGAGSCVLLSGPIGSGTSTLARAACDAAQRRGFTCVEATVSPLHGLLRPLLEATKRAIEGGLPGALDAEKYASAGEIARRLLGTQPDLHPDRGHALWALEQFLEQLAGNRPVAIRVEGAEEADADDLKAVQHLLLRVAQLPVLLLLTCSTDRGAPDRVTRLGATEGVRRIDVAALAREDAHRLLARVAEVTSVAPEVARRIHAVAQGNPLFTIELYRQLASSGIVVRQGSALVPGPAWGTDALPRRLADLYATRLARLAEGDRALLDAAAVDGLQLDGEALSAMVDQPLLTVLRRLQGLYREHGFVAPGPSSYGFANAALREVIYHDLAPDLRRALHLGLARHLEARPAGESDPERVGLHWERAGEPLRARPYLRRAASAAIARQEVSRGIDLAARAGIAGGRIDGAEAVAEADLVIGLADGYYGGGRAEDAEALLRALLEYPQCPETLRLRAFVHLAVVRYYRGGLSEADEREVRRAEQVLPPGRAKGLAHYLLGILAKYRGDLDAAETCMRSADGVYRACGLDAFRSAAMDQLASIAMRRGRLREAVTLYEEAARVAAQSGRRPNAAASRVNGALASLELGRIRGTAEVLDRAIAEFDIEGTLNLAAHARAILGSVRFAQGDLAGALVLAEDAGGRFARNSYLPGIADATLLEAHVHAIRGRLEEAEAALARAHAAAEKAQNLRGLEQVAAVHALLSAWRGHPPEAPAATVLAHARSQGGVTPANLLLVAEACAYSGSVPALRELCGLLLDAGSEEVLLPVARTVANAVAEATPASLGEAAAALRGEATGEWALLRALAALLEARSLGARDPAGAEAAALVGIDVARGLGHVWLELRLLALLAALFPRKDYSARFAEQLETAGPTGEAREPLRLAWSKADDYGM